MKNQTKTRKSATKPTKTPVPWTELRDMALKNLHARRKGHDALIAKFYDRRQVMLGSIPTVEQAIRHVMDHATGNLTSLPLQEVMSGKSPRAYIITDGTRVLGFDRDQADNATDVIAIVCPECNDEFGPHVSSDPCTKTPETAKQEQDT